MLLTLTQVRAYIVLYQRLVRNNLALREPAPDELDEDLLQGRLLPPRGVNLHPLAFQLSVDLGLDRIVVYEYPHSRQLFLVVNRRGDPAYASKLVQEVERLRGPYLHHDDLPPDLFLESRGRVAREHPPLVDDRHFVADRLALDHVVGRDEDCPSSLFGLVLEELPDGPRGYHVQAGGGLIHEDNLGVVDESPRYRNSLAKSSREHVQLLVEVLVELEQRGELPYALVRLLGRYPI